MCVDGCGWINVQVETVGDCFVAAAGLMEDDKEGFVRIASDHDPRDSASRMVEFAKGCLRHSRTICLPNSTTPVTVSET